MKSQPGVMPVTLTVSMDEPAIKLMETERRVLNAQGHSEDHRFLCIQVIRNDQVVEYVEDLGESSMYPGEAFIILADREPVGQLLDMAFVQRWAKPFAVQYGVPTPDIIGSYRQAAEERWKQANAITVSGPNFTKQRD